MKNKKDLVKIGKYLSLILRHQPEKIGLELDKNGWADVNQLVNKANVSRDILNQVVESNDKRRYSFSDNGMKIRANWGHSINVDLGLEPVRPPDVLYHGTATKFLDSIYASGIEKRSRDHVHLSTVKDIATQVASRHGKPFILDVDAKQMHEDGLKFYFSTNANIWLND